MGAQAARIAQALRKRATDALKMLALEIDRELRIATPVDTGHARRNWIPNVGQPVNAVADGEELHTAGIARVIAYELGQGAIWISNCVPYIRSLNYGHSQQAPAGFVERAIAIAMQTVEHKLGSGSGISALREQFTGEIGGQAAGNLAGAYSPFGD